MFHYENLFLIKDNTHMIRITTYKTTGKITTASAANSGTTTTIINNVDTSKIEAKIKELQDQIDKLKKRIDENMYEILDLRITEDTFNDMFKYGKDNEYNTTIVANYKIEQPK